MIGEEGISLTLEASYCIYYPIPVSFLTYLNRKQWGIQTSSAFHSMWGREEHWVISEFIRPLCCFSFHYYRCNPYEAPPEGRIHLNKRQKQFLIFNEIKVKVAHTNSKERRERPGWICYPSSVSRSSAKCCLQGAGFPSAFSSFLLLVRSDQMYLQSTRDFFPRILPGIYCIALKSTVLDYI